METPPFTRYATLLTVVNCRCRMSMYMTCRDGILSICRSIPNSMFVFRLSQQMNYLNVVFRNAFECWYKVFYFVSWPTFITLHLIKFQVSKEFYFQNISNTFQYVSLFGTQQQTMESTTVSCFSKHIQHWDVQEKSLLYPIR